MSPVLTLERRFRFSSHDGVTFDTMSRSSIQLRTGPYHSSWLSQRRQASGRDDDASSRDDLSRNFVRCDDHALRFAPSDLTRKRVLLCAARDDPIILLEDVQRLAAVFRS